MSSLKYIFVIEGNQLIRKIKEEMNEEVAPAEQYFKEPTDVRGDKELSSKTTEHQQRNKRNTTSRGK